MAQILAHVGDFIQKIKSLIASFTFLSKDVLHVYGGALFFMLWFVLLKRKKQYLCLVLICLAAVINEILDISYYTSKTNRIDWAESISDIFNTVFAPFALFLFLKFENRTKPNKNEQH